MLRRNAFALLSGLIVIIACNQTVIKYSSIYPKHIKRSSCAIFFPESIKVDYRGNVEDEFGKGEKNELIVNFFKTQCRNEIEKQTIFKQVFITLPLNEYRRKSVDLLTKLGVKTFEIPTENVKIFCQEGNPDIVVVFDDIKISSRLNSKLFPAGPVPVGGSWSLGVMDFMPTVSSSKNIIVLANFMIWDNKTGTHISHGFIEIIDKNRFAVSIEDWQKL